MEQDYTQENWNAETRRYYCIQNDFGQWWPMLKVKALSGGWCQIYIRDSNPFKTLSGAIRYIEKHRARRA